MRTLTHSVLPTRRSWFRPRRRPARLVRAAAFVAAPVLVGIGAGMALPAPVPAEVAPPAPAPERPVSSRRRWARRLARAIAELALTLAALAGVAGVGVTVLAARAEIRPLVVRSGSMAPTVPAGSMVLVQRVDAADLRAGDVVAVGRPDGTRVMHRILTVALDSDGVTASLTLKGDANEDPDPQAVPVVEAEKLIWHVPWVGRSAAWLATAPGGFALGCLVTGLLTLVVRGRRRSGPED